MLQLLKNTNYLRLWFAQVVSELGDGLSNLVILYLVSTFTNNPLAYTMILVARFFPNILFGTLVGPLIDRFSKKQLLIGADLFRALILFLMIFSQSSLVGLTVLIFLQGVGTVFFEPSRTATIPRIVEKSKIPEAISLSQSTFMLMLIISPLLGGLLLVSGQYSLIFLIDAGTFIASALLIMTLSIKEINNKAIDEEQGNQTYLESMKNGIKTIYQNHFLIGIIALLMIGMFVMNVVSVNMNPVILNVFEVDEFHFGTLTSVEGFFALLGALIVPYFMKKIKTNTFVIITIAYRGGMCLMIIPIYEASLHLPLVPLYIWMSLVGFCNTFINIPLNSMYMQAVPEHLLGRVSGVITTATNACLLLGLVLGGLTASMIGPMWTVTIGGGLLLAMSLIFPRTKYFSYLIVEKEFEFLNKRRGV